MKFTIRLRPIIRYKLKKMKINIKLKDCKHGVMSKELIYKMIGNELI